MNQGGLYASRLKHDPAPPPVLSSSLPTPCLLSILPSFISSPAKATNSPLLLLSWLPFWRRPPSTVLSASRIRSTNSPSCQVSSSTTLGISSNGDTTSFTRTSNRTRDRTSLSIPSTTES